MRVRYRWNAGPWTAVSGLGDAKTVRDYLRARYPSRVARGATLEVEDMPTRGRPTSAAAARTWIQIRVTHEQKALLQRIARAHGVTLTEFMLQAAANYKGDKS